MSSFDVSLMDTKEFKKFAKEVGEAQAKELLQKSDEDLKAVISAHTMSCEQATSETKNTEAYLKAVEVTKDFNKALREKLKPLTLAIKLSAKVLNSRKHG